MPRIVPTYVLDAVSDAIEQEIKRLPDEAPTPTEEERESLRNNLLRYYDTHGEIPDFTISYDE